MAAYVTEDWSQRQYRPGESARQVFYVSDATDAQQAINLVGIAKGNGFYLDNRLKAGSPDATSPKSPTQFYVSIDFAPLDDGASESDIDKPPRWRLIPQKSQIPVDRDRFGNPITNSARDPFDQAPSRDYTDLIYEYRRYESSLNIAVAIAYQDVVNSDTVTLPGVGGSIAPGQGKLEIYAQEEDSTRDSEAVLVLYRIAIRRDGWKTRILDQGYKIAVNVSGITSVQAYDAKGDPVSSPIRLNGRGAAIDPQFVPKEGNALSYVGPPTGAELEETADAAFLRYELYEPLPFAALSLTV